MKLKILGIKPAVSKADKIYWKVQTNKGTNFTAFDEVIVEVLEAAVVDKKELNLTIVPSADGRYQNIRGFAMDDEEEFPGLDSETKKVISPQEFGKSFIPGTNELEMKRNYHNLKEGLRKSVKGSAYEKDPVGLAVEVFCDLSEKQWNSSKDRMQEAVNIVKQAQEAFK